MKHTIQFLNPTWHYGTNVTVRLGDKWNKNAEIGDSIKLVKTCEEGRALVEGTVTKKIYCRFMDLPVEVLALEHDRECAFLGGLVIAMLRSYPEFNHESMVTAIYFEIK